MRVFISNLMYGFRLSGKDPLTTILCVLLLSFGIGLISVTFQVINYSVLVEVPLPEQERVVPLMKTSSVNENTRTIRWGIEEYKAFKETAQSYSALAPVVFDLVSLDDGEKFTRQNAAYAGPGFFDIFNGTPLLGRVLTPEDSRASASPVMVINEKVWDSAFFRDPKVLGKNVIVDGTSYTIVGVLPFAYSYPFSSDLWIPLNLNTIEAVTGRVIQVFPFGRLKPGVSPAQAQEEASVALRRIQKELNIDQRFDGVRISPFARLFSSDDNRKFALLLLVIGAFVLLMACTNVVGLLMNRLYKRMSELAIRSSLGATRKTIILQLLTESLTLYALAIAGSLLNVYIYFKWIFVPMASGNNMPRWMSSQEFFSARYYLVIASVALFTVLISQLIPALRATGKNIHLMMRESTRTSSSLRVSRFSKWVVVIQLALSATVLTTVSVFISSQKFQLQESEIYPVEPLTHADIGLDGINFPERPDRFEVYESLRKELLKHPQVEDVAITNESQGFTRRVTVAIDGVNYAKPEDRPRWFHRLVSPGAFKALGVPVIKGREFLPSDTYESPLVVMVTQSAVDKYWPDVDPIGKRIILDSDQGVETLTIVGVVSDLWSDQIFDGGAEGMVRPLGQETWGSVGLYVKAKGDPATIERIISESGRKVNTYMSIMNIQPLADLQESFRAGNNFLLVIFSSFGLGSILMLSTGLYGILNNIANNRRQEMAIRASLGASPLNLMGAMFKQGYAHTVIGLSLGAIGGYYAAQFLKGVLPVFVPNVGSLIIVFVGLFLIATISIGVPALRTTRMNPMNVLRQE